jgi:hypothetical protein
MVWLPAKPLTSRLLVASAFEKERDRVQDAYRRLTGTESVIPETHTWQVRPAFRNRNTAVSRLGSVAYGG